MNEKILVVDDSLFFNSQICNTLRKAGYTVFTADSGEKGLHLVDAEKPDLMLLDVVMPDMDGFEVVKLLRDQESNNLMPIILLTSNADQDDKLRGLELGADDYITKPFDERELLSRIRNTLRRIARNRSANPLTGLSGNIEIQREINSRIAREKDFAVVYVDLDNFKSFNDVYGFAKGDLAIKMTADILSEQTRLFGKPGDFVGHIGGDDFVIITTPECAPVICRECIAKFDPLIRTLYNEEDQKRGYISTVNRKGEQEVFPIITVSLGIVTNTERDFANHLEVSEVASQLKKKLKTMPGSNYITDRRKA